MAVPPPPPRPAAAKPAAPPAPPKPAAAPVAAAKPAAAPAATDEKKERVVKFGSPDAPVPTTVGGIDLNWFKDSVKAIFDTVPGSDGFAAAFDGMEVSLFPNTSEGKRAYKLAKAIYAFHVASFKKARAARATGGKVADRVRAVVLEMVQAVGADLIKSKIGEEKWNSYNFTEAELAA